MMVVKAALALTGVAAVALYVVVMLVVELIMRLLPLIVLAAVVALGIYLWRRRIGSNTRRRVLPIPGTAGADDNQQVAMPRTVTPGIWAPVPVPGPPVVATHRDTHVIVGGDEDDSHHDGYLRFGPPTEPSATSGGPYTVSGNRSHARRSGSQARPRSTRP